MSQVSRRLPIGAEVQPDGSTHFRVWAPRPRDVRLVLERSGGTPDIALESEGGGYHSALVPDVGEGVRYRYSLDGRLFADPASRFQPEGPFGPSQVVDPARYAWRTESWKGISLRGQVLYELHVGTFTPEGTWHAATDRLPHLRRTGITVVEVMPVSEFPGRFGWGYDGVFPYAPTRLYGVPDDFRRFVDSAHHQGLGVILDVVYNHLGPSGCVHREFAEAYFSRAHGTEWGDALNFDGRDSDPVREYFIGNAGYWIDEFHLDGLRLDALHSIKDRSDEHVIAALSRRARQAAGARSIVVVAENEHQDTGLLRREPVLGGIDGMWNDDFHHSAVVALTGRREAYYSDHYGKPQEFISAAKYGFLFQGQRYAWQKQARGQRTDGIPPASFITSIENHDQVANSGMGTRIHQDALPARYRAMTALFLLLPATPMLFQGQEFGATSPFLYFADHEEVLAKAVQKGRTEFLSQFPSMSAEKLAALPPPHDPLTFERCKLRWEESWAHKGHWLMYVDLLALRREDEAFRQQQHSALDGAVLSDHAFVLRFTAPDPADERVLIVNLGPYLTTGSFPEPLVAPRSGCTWETRWSSEDPRYGGSGARQIVTGDGWQIPWHSTTCLRPAMRAPGHATPLPFKHTP